MAEQHHEANFTCKTSVTREMALEAFLCSRRSRRRFCEKLENVLRRWETGREEVETLRSSWLFANFVFFSLSLHLSLSTCRWRIVRAMGSWSWMFRPNDFSFTNALPAIALAYRRPNRISLILYSNLEVFYILTGQKNRRRLIHSTSKTIEKIWFAECFCQVVCECEYWIVEETIRHKMLMNAVALGWKLARDDRSLAAFRRSNCKNK